MASRAMVTLDEVRMAVPGSDGTPDELLSRCIDAASVAIERATRRRFVEDDYDAHHSGELAVGGVRLYLADPASGLATLPVTAISEITEDGTELDIYRLPGSGPPSFSDGEAALVRDTKGVVERVTVTDGKLRRRAWSTGIANIRIAYTAGWARESFPEDLRQVCIELTWLMAREGGRAGIESLAISEYTARFARLLPPSSKRILEEYRFPASPVTVVG